MVLMMVKKAWVLIMLILIGLVPLAYSLNKSLDANIFNHLNSFQVKQRCIECKSNELSDEKARAVLTKYIQTKRANT